MARLKKKKISPSNLLVEKKEITPYDSLKIIKEIHLEKYGWGGCCIKAFRIGKSMTIKMLAERLRYRVHKLRTYEEEKRPIGIKLAKQLGEIFKVDWHVFRDQEFIITTKEKVNVQP
jgi:hypothetical protein